MKVFNKHTWIVNSLRRASYRWPGRYQAVINGRSIQKLSRGRMVWHYNCAMCPKDIHHCRKNIKLDHICPVVPPETGFTTWDDYITRMFVEADGFQVLCTDHHKEKTALERIERNKFKKKA